MSEPLQGGRKLRDSVAWKLVVIGGLILLLLVPLLMVRLLIAERAARRDGAAQELAATWGGAQTLGGPLLTVPYRVTSRDGDGRLVVRTELAQFLPETLHVEGSIAPERRTRGIFEAVLYRADLRLTGTFARPDFAPWHVAPGDVLWEDATLQVGVGDMRGIRRLVRLRWGRQMRSLSPASVRPGLWDAGLEARVPGLAEGERGRLYPFAFDLGLNGSGSLRFLPAGATTTVALRSTWSDPSFQGAYLPDRRAVGPGGFQATWKVPFFGRGYPQAWRADDEAALLRGGSVAAASAFGVELYLPVDAYQKTERSLKYAVLFLLLTFVTFFLYEVFQPFSLHPLQYLLVGAALCLFYLLLLSVSEHLPFAAAYAVAAAATVALIAGYSAAMLRGRGRAALMGGVLALLYGYLYVLLQAEDYALLLGAVGLFLVLALVMYATRRIDWYAPRQGRGEAREATE